MGKGTNVNRNEITRTFSWNEIHEHSSKDDRWIVVDGLVYDITRFQKKHPGGAKIIGHFAGQDATEVWRAMHNDKELVQKYMKSICIGAVEKRKGPTKAKDKTKSLLDDFETLRQNAIKMGFFKVNPWFFIAHLAHIMILEIIASYFAAYMGSTWQSFFLTSLIVCIYQAQAGWTQHDYGHQSVFNSTRLNHLMHHFTVGFIKGASSHWWNFRHFQHHAKPNVFKKDPDITVPQLFMIGENIPAKWGKQKRGKMPYNQQHNYFWILGPLGLLPIYFHLEVLYFVFKRRDWMDLSMIVGFFIRNQMLFAPTFGGWGAFGLYMFARTLESFWFTFVTQMSHIPMEIDEEKNHDWVTAQTISTTNVEPGLFNDWFTGHLNFQIEHHLFPTMPRHNYIKVMPMVKELCKKHGVPYTCKTLYTAFADIIRSLKKSGEIWYDAYYHM